MFEFDREFKKLMTERKLCNVVITGHINPDGDCVGSVMGLAHYIRQVYPEFGVWPYLSNDMEKGIAPFIAGDAEFSPYVMPETDRYLHIACDTANTERIFGRELMEGADAVMVLDHHASDMGYGDIWYVEPLESCAQVIYEALDRESFAKVMAVRKEGSPSAGDYLYLGMLHDTNRFTRADAGCMKMASELLAMGVDHRKIAATLESKTLQDKLKEAQILSLSGLYAGGKVAVIFLDHNEVCKRQISYEEIHPVSGILRDCADITVGVTMYEEIPEKWRISFRSDGTVDVNKIASVFGGGGHKGAAGLTVYTKDGISLKEKVIGVITKALLPVTETE